MSPLNEFILVNTSIVSLLSNLSDKGHFSLLLLPSLTLAQCQKTEHLFVGRFGCCQLQTKHQDIEMCLLHTERETKGLRGVCYLDLWPYPAFSLSGDSSVQLLLFTIYPINAHVPNSLACLLGACSES
ncbi:hypothetical protein ATANTOWER_013058 [Ataeniobius toweri]|uniref:Uncharacterized protein n=1 Tax=Ataeniobius toweri TaxID=208326 RepID=A0ABU7BZ29_9TELE|nr:hypothetical protein [Ataeniobius toweri]